jgi:hypothetical protein
MAMDPDIKDVIGEEGGCSAVISAMHSHVQHVERDDLPFESDNLLFHGCLALMCLAKDNVDNQKRIARQGGVLVVKRIIERLPNHAGVQQYGIAALQSFAMGTEDQQECIEVSENIEVVLAAP